jgi:hypothetical protein
VSASGDRLPDPVEAAFEHPIQLEMPLGLSVEFPSDISVALQGRIPLHSAEAVPPTLSDLIRPFLVALFSAVAGNTLPVFLGHAIPPLLKCPFRYSSRKSFIRVGLRRNWTFIFPSSPQMWLTEFG